MADKTRTDWAAPRLDGAKLSHCHQLREELADIGHPISDAAFADTLDHEPHPVEYLRNMLRIHRVCDAGGTAPHVGLDPTTGGQ